MATLRDLYDSLEIEDEPIAEDSGDGFDFSDLLTAGKGALFGALDVADRPGRAFRHLLRGDLRQAAEAFDPFNFFTEEESRPISGREVLFGDEENPEGIDTKDVLGFGAEVALDPLTYVGGALGRFAARILGPVGGASTGILEGLGGTLGSLKEGGRAFRLGQKAAAVSPLAATAVGAAGGGLLGALDPEMTAGEGALLGGAAGFGLRAAGPALARGGIAGLESVSRTFAERNVKNLTPFRRELLAKHAGDGLKKLNAVNRMRAMERALAEEGRERLSKLVEDPFFAEIYGVERLGAEAGKTRLMGLGDETVESLESLGAEDLFAAAKGTAPEPTALAKAVKGRSGKEVLESARSQIARLTPQDKVVLDKFYGGAGKEGLLPGKFWQEQILEQRGIIPQDWKDEFVRISGLAQAPHVRNAQTADELQHATLQAIREALGPRANDLAPAQLLVEAKRAKGALRRRGILGSLPQLEEKFPGFFSQDLARIGLEQNRRFIAFTRVDDALDATLQKAQDHGWLVTGAAADPSLIQAGVLRKVDPSVLPFQKHRAAVKALGAGDDVYLRREVHDLLFRKGGFIDRALNRDSVTEFGKFWRKATNLWKGWTLAAFPSWIARNVFGNAWLNHVSGVGPEHLATYGHAMTVQKAIGKLLRDEEVTGSILLKGGQRHDLATLAREAIEDGIMGSGFVQTEVGEAFRAAAAGEKTWDAVKFFDPQHNFITKTGFGINAAGEDWMRLTHYLAKRSDGLDRAAALESTKLNLYDFDELTPFEQERLREFFPFYAWFRQNLAGSTRHLVTSPQRVAFVGRMAINLDKDLKADVPDAAIPEWLQGQLHVPISRGKDGTLRIFSLQNWLPLADLAQVETPEKFLQFVVNAAHPVLNEALEQGFNFDTFFKRSIERVAGERTQFLGFNVTKRGEHLAKNLRVLNELDLAMEAMGLTRSGRHRMDDVMEDISATEFAARGIGVKIRPINLPLARQRKLASLRREIASLLGKQRQARRDGNEPNVRLLARLMAERRQDLQLLAQWDPMTHPTYASLASPEVP